MEVHFYGRIKITHFWRCDLENGSSGAAAHRWHRLTTRQQMSLTLQLSWPAIMAQLATIIQQYIDAAMVGRLGATQSAAVGLVASTTWLFGGCLMRRLWASMY